MYFSDILNNTESSYRHRESAGKGDWITMVEEDIRELEINLTLEEIEVVSKAGWKELVSKKVPKKAF